MNISKILVFVGKKYKLNIMKIYRSKYRMLSNFFKFKKWVKRYSII